MTFPIDVSDANARAFILSARSPFPHMSELDAEVWRAFLASGMFEFEELFYDVAVGGSAAALVDDSEEMKPMWTTLLKKRIDVVVPRKSEVWTVEVKPTANMSSIGQALSYATLFNESGRSKLPARPVVVCGRIDGDLVTTFTAYGVLVFVVEWSESVKPHVVRVIGSYLL